MSDPSEANRLSARASRYARVGVNLGGVAARMAASRLSGASMSDQAGALASALGGLKGPMMKVAQLLSTIPDAVPPAYAAELQKLQSDAPPMGSAFVRRRMMSELGPDWRSKFAQFDFKPAAAASLGQVHRATSLQGEALACKLQYPDMASAVEADLAQLRLLLSIQRRLDPAIDASQIIEEISARIREELDYTREARHAALYRLMLAQEPSIRVPACYPELSTRRLLSLEWLQGEKLLSFRDHPASVRNEIATAMFKAWWLPFSRYGTIHGDPHLGNYTIFTTPDQTHGLNLLDYGCIRIFPARFVGGVVDLYHGLRQQDEARIVHAYESWGFKGLTRGLIDTLNLWARFIYGLLLDDRTRTVADGVAPGQYGRAEAQHVHESLKRLGPVTVPREFVFMDRAAIGLGGVFLHLNAELNFYALFNAAIDNFSVESVAARQAEALARVALEPSDAP